MTSKNAIRRDDETTHEGEREAPRVNRRRVGRFIAPAAVALTVAGLSAVAAHRAEAKVPPCRYELMSATALDKETGLTWQRTSVNTSYQFAEAQKYCANLSLEGQKGWRLPTLQELLTLVDDSQVGPSIDSKTFPDLLGTAFWSSTTNADDPARIWFVSFFGGITDNDSKGGSHFVRCVR